MVTVFKMLLYEVSFLRENSEIIGSSKVMKSLSMNVPWKSISKK